MKYIIEIKTSETKALYYDFALIGGNISVNFTNERSEAHVFNNRSEALIAKDNLKNSLNIDSRTVGVKL